MDSQEPAPASKKRRKQAAEEMLEDKRPKSTGKGKKKSDKKVQGKTVEKKATQSIIPHQVQEESEVSDVGERGKSPQAIGEDNDSDYHLHGFSTDEDSSDEDLDVDDEAGVDVGKLPTVSKDDAVVKRKLERAKRQPV